MLEPQSTGLFVLLMVVFGGLIWWLLVTRQPVLRLLAACLAFVPAMLFGVVAVNKYRFPVIELIHGQPGEPQDWINVVGITATLDRLASQRRAKPAVLVMPDVNGAQRISLQCLNQAGGPQDLTYLAQELPLAIAHRFRVDPPGPAWAVAGYSEGGFCAANMALRFPARYGFAGVLSGYFKPARNQLEFPLRQVSPFGGNRKLAARNTPLDEIRTLRLGTPIPQFWLGAGTANKDDVAAAEVFWQELSLRQAAPHSS